MTTPHHRTVIAAALDDWWITTDPSKPFDTTAVADAVDAYLISSGYHIALDTRILRMPTRRTIATTLLLILITAASTAWAAHRGNWWWAGAGATAALLLTVEAARDLRDRRAGRDSR